MRIPVEFRYPADVDQTMADAINAAEDALDADPSTAAPAWEEVYRLAHASQHTEAIGYASLGIARTLGIDGKLDDATARIQEALDSFQQIGDERWLGETWAFAGRIFADAGDDEAAANAYRTALEHARRTDDRHLLGRCLIDNADIVLEDETYDKSIDRALEGVELLEQFDDPDAQARAWEVVARLYADLGEWRPAITAGERVLELFRNIGDLQHIGRFLTLLGYWSLEIGAYDVALKRSREAGPLVRKHGSKMLNLELLILQADLYARTGRVADGAARLDDAEALARELGTTLRDEVIATIRHRLADAKSAPAITTSAPAKGKKRK